MRLCSNQRLARAVIFGGLLAFALGFVVLLGIAAVGCTVVPKPVAAETASFGENGTRNSGFLGFVDGGALIDRGARERYNALIKLYGREWLPAIKRDHGVQPRGEVYFLTNDALQKFIVMSDWKKMGRQPK